MAQPVFPTSYHHKAQHKFTCSTFRGHMYLDICNKFTTRQYLTCRNSISQKYKFRASMNTSESHCYDIWKETPGNEKKYDLRTSVAERTISLISQINGQKRRKKLVYFIWEHLEKLFREDCKGSFFARSDYSNNSGNCQNNVSKKNWTYN